MQHKLRRRAAEWPAKQKLGFVDGGPNSIRVFSPTSTAKHHYARALCTPAGHAFTSDLLGELGQGSFAIRSICLQDAKRLQGWDSHNVTRFTHGKASTKVWKVRPCNILKSSHAASRAFVRQTAVEVTDNCLFSLLRAHAHSERLQKGWQRVAEMIWSIAHWTLATLAQVPDVSRNSRLEDKSPVSIPARHPPHLFELLIQGGISGKASRTSKFFVSCTSRHG